MPADRAPRAGAPRVVAAAILAVQALALVAFSVFYLVELIGGGSDSPARVLTSVVLILLFAAGLVLLARGILRAAPWARTPAVLWQVLLVPIAWGLFQSGRAVIGGVVLVVAVAGIVAVALAARDEQGPE